MVLYNGPEQEMGVLRPGDAAIAIAIAAAIAAAAAAAWARSRGQN